jgi:NAD(P)-dependent dehydrogenase (short-subunit alcohol dehydrogenase family)
MNEEQVKGVLGKRIGNNLEFAGKVALITGGNSGIGVAAAIRWQTVTCIFLTGWRKEQARNSDRDGSLGQQSCRRYQMADQRLN